MNSKFLQIEKAHQKVTKILAPLSIDVTVLLGGGAIRDLAFDLEDPKDFDMYVIPKEKLALEDVVPFLKLTRDLLITSFPKTKNAIEDEQLDSFIGIARDQHCTVKLLDADDENKIPYQFLYKTHSQDPQELVEFFDLDICQFGYDGDQFYIGSEVDMVAVRNAIFNGGPVTLMQPTSTYSRLKKFKDRYSCEIRHAVYELHNTWSQNPQDIGAEFLGNPKGDEHRIYWKSPKSVLREPKEEDFDPIADVLMPTVDVSY